MKKFLYSLIFFLIFLGVLVFAQEENLEGIIYPVPELGNCGNKEECKIYCDLPENMEICLDFAETHNLLPSEEIERGRKLLEAGLTGGPGGCQGQEECEAYCDDINHIRECVSFAEEHGLIPSEELAEAKLVIAAIDQGIIPPACNRKSECDVYCSAPEHMEECITFGEAAGLIPPGELEEAKKVLEAIKKGAKPPPCKGKAECDIYCEQPEHLEECINFAIAAGFISPEEAEMVKKTGGKGPGGCRGKEECDAYCDDSAHMKECIDFAVQYGFMPAEEAQQALKMLEAGLTGGPGGCKGQAECDAYCNDLSHMEECIDFAVKAGFMSPEEAEQAKKMAQMGVTSGPGGCKGKEECEAYCNNPDNVQECIEFGEKMGMISPEEAEKGKEMMMQGGPGGCKTKEECEAYCSDQAHMQECIDFSIQQGFISAEEAEKMMPSGEMLPPPGEGIPYTGPGGCQTAEECTSYCSQPEHSEECQNFAKPPEGGYIPPPEGYTAPPEGTQPPEGYTPPPEGYTPPEEYTPPEGYTPLESTIPSPEIINPPSEEAPQSLLDLLNHFFANIGAFLK